MNEDSLVVLYFNDCLIVILRYQVQVMQHFLLILYFNFENLPCLIFLEFAQNPNPKRFYVVHFLANKIIRGRFWVLERTKVKSTFVRITTNNSKLSCSHR